MKWAAGTNQQSERSVEVEQVPSQAGNVIDEGQSDGSNGCRRAAARGRGVARKLLSGRQLGNLPLAGFSLFVINLSRRRNRGY